jgi:hypothetical protein
MLSKIKIVCSTFQSRNGRICIWFIYSFILVDLDLAGILELKSFQWNIVFVDRKLQFLSVRLTLQ